METIKTTLETYKNWDNKSLFSHLLFLKENPTKRNRSLYKLVLQEIKNRK